MYVRSRVPMTPPVNYAGVTFSRGEPQSTEREKDTKIHKATQNSEIKPAPRSVFEDIEADDVENCAKEQEVIEEKCDIKKSVHEQEAPKCAEKEAQKGFLSDILGDKFTLEDILLFAALFLLVSGQIDDEILLLAGILLLFCN